MAQHLLALAGTPGHSRSHGCPPVRPAGGRAAAGLPLHVNSPERTAPGNQHTARHACERPGAPLAARARAARTLPQQTRSAGAQPSAAARPAQKGPPPRTCASRTGALRGVPMAWPPALQGPPPCAQAQRDPELQKHARAGTAPPASCARRGRRSVAPGRTRRRPAAAWRRTRGRSPAPRLRPARRRRPARPRRRRASGRARAGARPAGRPSCRPPHRRLRASQDACSDRQADRAG